MLEFICPTCGTFSFEAAACATCEHATAEVTS